MNELQMAMRIANELDVMCEAERTLSDAALRHGRSDWRDIHEHRAKAFCEAIVMVHRLFSEAEQKVRINGHS